MLSTLRDSRGFQVCVVRTSGAMEKPGEVRGTAHRRGDGFAAHSAKLTARLKGKGAASKPLQPPKPAPHVIAVRACLCPPCDHPIKPCIKCALESGCSTHRNAAAVEPWRGHDVQWCAHQPVSPEDFRAAHGIDVKAWMNAHNK